MNFSELSGIDCYTFKSLLRDAVIYKMEKTDEGRDYLEKCWILGQTTPDVQKLKETFGGKTDA